MPVNGYHSHTVQKMAARAKQFIKKLDECSTQIR